MQFVFVVKGQSSRVPQALPADRLFIVASRETAHRSRHVRAWGAKKYSAAVPASGAPLQISGSRLRDLCWRESHLSSTLSLEKDDLTFNCVMVQTPYAGRAADADLEPVPLRVIAADALEHIFFNINEDLLQDGRLVVFTYAENLLHLSIDADIWAEARVAAPGPRTGVAVGADGGTGDGGKAGSRAAEEDAKEGPSLNTDGAAEAGLAKRRRRVDLMWGEEEPSRSSRRLDSPHSLLNKEEVLAVVPSAMSGDDIKELNELIDEGKLSSLDASLTDFFCCQCYHLPLLTLTMSCCGAVLCQCCAPTPPTVEGVSAADRACPVCGEEPLDPPLSHLERDVKVAKLVKELKVLYLPQLHALRNSRQASAEPSKPSPPPFLLPNTPVLGSPR
ncbi:conserved hypothetical protein [Leishmania major strain Friedlin]|uniref:Uncharacterized protein n=1 Tax=Leishmania major TaxID=5664 RepID=Q4QD09_LEIMA|nr:conserved hypothetical protein [Leishmania major strain Friedlin]CAG9573106.1 hypothetical_protein_-_conserved [Leishmania major strain Friedlin]CAJ03629.1 conserved hypothetical protein [Leishmania major strain Friedlin]|eukprot:XP_001682789.1 conserved hypothetical protein [Leishmania major strain Friedlin]